MLQPQQSIVLLTLKGAKRDEQPSSVVLRASSAGSLTVVQGTVPQVPGVPPAIIPLPPQHGVNVEGRGEYLHNQRRCKN